MKKFVCFSLLGLALFLTLSGCPNSPSTEPDKTPPAVTATNPAGGSTGIPINLSLLKIVFSEAVKGVDSSSVTVNGGVSGSIAYDSTNHSASFSITSGNLAPSTLYTVTLNSSIKDMSDNALSATSFSFTTGTTGDNTAPAWISGYPTNSNLAASSFKLKVNVNEDGIIYYIVVNNGGTAPNSSQVTNGVTYAGATVVKAGNSFVSSNTESLISITGLTPNTIYNVYVVAKDFFGNLGSVQTFSLTTLIQIPQLTLNILSIGNLALGGTNWYSFNTTAGQTYAVYWDDSYEGSGGYTADLRVSAFNSNFSATNFFRIDSGYFLPKYISNASGGTYNIRVEGYTTNESGTYAIKVATPPVMHTISGNITMPASQTGKVFYVLLSITPSTSQIVSSINGLTSGISFHYSLTAPAGSYYLFGLVDTGTNGYPFDPGDYLGFYGGSGTNAPVSANVILNSDLVKNFTLGIQ